MNVAGASTGPITTWPATQLADAIRRGTVSAIEAIDACLARVEQLDPSIHAFVTVHAESARAAALDADKLRASGAPLPPLHGVPFAAKDAFVYPGTRTTVGSTRLQDYEPALPPAACIRDLQCAGAILIGKTNVGSGMAPPKLTPSRVQPTRNPWNPDRTAGGSSSGSAAGVALGMFYGSVGTDLGGSIRNPASFCGVVGLKPTHGLVSLEGNIFGMGGRAEHVGPLARTVGDVALFLGGLVGSGEPISLAEPLDASAIGIAVVNGGGVVEAVDDVLRAVDRAYAALADGGFRTDRIDLPYHDEALWLLVTLFDEWEAFERASPTTDQYLGYIAERLTLRRARTQQWLDTWTAEITRAYDELFETYDLLALGTAPITARRFDELTLPWRGADIATADLHSVNTWMFNLTGHPAITVPCGFDDEGMPVGLQLVARHNEEALLLQVAQRYESTRGAFPMPQPPDRAP